MKSMFAPERKDSWKLGMASPLTKGRRCAKARASERMERAMLLEGKKLLITGVLTPQSIAFGIAELAQKQGAQLILTGFGRGMSLTERSAKRLSPVPEILELDVNQPDHFKRLTEQLKQKMGVLHGAL